MSDTTEGKSALAWLASADPEPDVCRREWERAPHGVALLPAGRKWDVLMVPGGLGRPSLEVLARRVGRLGPVLAAGRGSRTGFFVPPGTAAGWVGGGVRGVGEGGWIATPHPVRPGSGIRWLVPPDGSGTLTEPTALELAMHEAAALVAGGRMP